MFLQDLWFVIEIRNISVDARMTPFQDSRHM